MCFFFYNNFIYKINLRNDQITKESNLYITGNLMGIKNNTNLFLFRRSTFPLREDLFYDYDIKNKSAKLIKQNKYDFFETEKDYSQMRGVILSYKYNQFFDYDEKMKISNDSENIFSYTFNGTSYQVFLKENLMFRISEYGQEFLFDTKTRINYSLGKEFAVLNYQEATKDFIFFAGFKIYHYSNEKVEMLGDLSGIRYSNINNFSEDNDYYYFVFSKSLIPLKNQTRTCFYKISKSNYTLNQIEDSTDFANIVAIMPKYFITFKEGILYKYSNENIQLIDKKSINMSNGIVFFEQTANYLFLKKGNRISIINLDNYSELNF